MMTDKEIGSLTAGASAAAANFHGVESGNSRKFTGAEIARCARSGALLHFTADKTAQNYSAMPKISWDAAVYDTDSYWSAGTPSKLIVPADGWYEARGSVQVQNVTSSDYLRGFILKNGSSGGGLPVQYVPAISTLAGLTLATAMIQLLANDFLEFQIDTLSDTSIDLIAACSWFAIRRLG